ncbi:acetyltransferase [Neosynechococcus sphagnicola sy1]|uniref:Acetyltransferase n=1 Tax=Neosynechococcus sphagnicola sy1 TaxID=1497020 RepID=A0A098TNQ4_9CYAN|nr:GNAT family N-acetyltransferase [Neosynechococcus sphagnicola]KGF73965.1 acetyltransferase [Neosynechococcus sphagnicola sy1]
MAELIPGYGLRTGSGLERSLLLKFLQRTYQEFYPHQDFAHLSRTVEQYLSEDTPLWWVEAAVTESFPGQPRWMSATQPIGCLWMGNSVDQISGDRHAHIFLLYISPEHRRQGLGTALMHHAETWAQHRGDRQLGLQVFQTNQPALNLYRHLGFHTRSLWMVKPLLPER